MKLLLKKYNVPCTDTASFYINQRIHRHNQEALRNREAIMLGILVAAFILAVIL